MKDMIIAYKDYKEIELSKNPIKASYIITFLLITLLILFAATWFGFYIARGITVAIEKLAEATRSVAEGDLDQRVDVQADGEVGILVDSFYIMTQELMANKRKIEDATLDLQRSSAEIDQRRRYMEAMLEHIGTGVVSINRRGRVTILNNAAGELLRIAPEWALGKPFNQVFKAQHLEPIRRFLRTMREEGRKSVSEQVDVLIDGQLLALRASLTLLRDADERHLGAVVVFDDLSALIRAQKVAAWREVAQGIAHEIKNPLTPIQLSTERMRRKFEQKAVDFPEVFEIATDTIIHQVQGLMELVNEFSRFARMPEPDRAETDIAALLREVALLQQDALHGALKADLPDQPVIVDCDAGMMRQALTNLLKNAGEAVEERRADAPVGWSPMIRIEMETHPEAVCIRIIANGPGLPADRSRLFEPYGTLKSQGTGLGLPIVKKIGEEHGGSLVLTDAPERPGAMAEIRLPRERHPVRAPKIKSKQEKDEATP